MLYQRSYDIERRLGEVLRLIGTGTFSTPRIADELGVSIPTVSRDVLALRQRGFQIRSERTDDGWRYTLVHAAPNDKKRISGDQTDPVFRRSGGHRR